MWISLVTEHLSNRKKKKKKKREKSSHNCYLHYQAYLSIKVTVLHYFSNLKVVYLHNIPQRLSLHVSESWYTDSLRRIGAQGFYDQQDSSRCQKASQKTAQRKSVR